ncbi:ATP-dependent helicase [Oscillatoria sp. FACHB-1406]|uniref:ATP-dependent helicase n=1 Tax=Oscillatoria sp. FACHB-1406 TaxID=2692846 RepID=UPI00168293C0|nr:ATP-dependent helicase [Oscillatoria sp. FACHB-1406]MBD2579559.1 ATP-dependent helicase [Oscillatoria sp. FACHB-1406]
MSLETASSTNTSSQRDREPELQKMREELRPGQQSLADWQGGELAVSAVPGSGKSHGMAIAAAIAIARNRLHPKRQLIVVTFTRSAAASIKSKIRDRLRQLQLPAGGFVVHTLHGLALNIASRHPDLSRLNLESSTLIAPNQGHRLLKTAVDRWIATYPSRYKILLEGSNFDGEETERLRRQSALRTEILPGLANAVIREAKSSGILPEDLWRISENARDEYNILAIAAGLYEESERLMKARNFIDYDDMILAALRVLDNPHIRRLWQNQIFAVFEDEAQDSTPLQSRLLEILAADGEGERGRGGEGEKINLVRVGDPNQAINSTFTPADPIYFNQFCDRTQAENALATMNQAGRSAQIIIDAANFMLRWTNEKWQEEFKVQNVNFKVDATPATPFRLQDIAPVAPGDAQGNPDRIGNGLEIRIPNDIYHTVELMRDRILQLYQDNKDYSSAILVRENRQGRFLAEQLAPLQREHKIRLYEVGELERHSQIPEEILKLLHFLDRPHSPDALKSALEVLEARQRIPAQDLNLLATQPEQFLYPGILDSPQKPAAARASRYCRNLLRARLELPPYHLISFLGMTLQYQGSELATVQKLGDRIAHQLNRQHSLKAILEALEEIVTSERFEGVEEDSDDRYSRPGQLTIITMHKAKGLDWDCVFLPFLHEDLIPGKPWIPNAAKFLGDFTLAEVARAQIRTALHQQYLEGYSDAAQLPQPLEAWEQACKLKKAEEYRLLYVAMTRAKRLLWMSAARQAPFSWGGWQPGGNLQGKIPCPVIPALLQKFPAAN